MRCSSPLRSSSSAHPQRGSALIAALWVIAFLSFLVFSFAFEVKLEARVADYYRRRIKAEHLARSGVELARFLLDQAARINPEKPEPEDAEQPWFESARRLREGLNVVSFSRELGEGIIRLAIVPEPARINVNELKTFADWEPVFDQGGIPEEDWATLFDSFMDWIDPDDIPRPDGAESDDYYLQLDPPYRAKNAPLDTVDELLLIRGFTNTYVYGGFLQPKDPESEERGAFIPGIADLLTTYGSRQVNINAASLRVLMALSLDIDEPLAREIILEREGDPENPDLDTSYRSADDFFNRFPEFPDLRNRLQNRITVQSQIMRITSSGQIGDVGWIISCIAERSRKGFRILRWQEEPSP